MLYSLGSINLHLYGTIITLAILAGFLVAKKRAKLYKIPQQQVEDIYLILIPSCLVGARFYHLFHQWQYYLQNPKQILAIWQGGLGIYGAIIAGIFALFVYSKAKRLSFLTLTDFLFPSVTLTQAIGRLGNFFNQEAFGPPTNLPWKIYIAPEKRPSFWEKCSFFHPLFLYESIFMFFGFLVLLRLNRHPKLVSGSPTLKIPKRVRNDNQEKKAGLTTGVYFILYGTIRFLTELGRFDTWQITGVKVAQVLSIIAIGAGLYLISSDLLCRRF